MAIASLKRLQTQLADQQQRAAVGSGAIPDKWMFVLAK